MAETILVVDDERDIRLTLGGLLADEGFLVAQASSAHEALERLEESLPSLVVLDLWMGGSEEGFTVLNHISEERPQLPVVVISGHGNVETAVKAVKNGAFDFIEKPLSADKLLLTVQRALDFRRLSEENRVLRGKSFREGKLFVGASASMLALIKTIEMVAPTPASILITGENGVGKEIVAQTVHSLSDRASRPMVEINCAAIPEELVESELFGHEKGAFTGADRKRHGKFDTANHSTLFLDEIGDMSLKTQAKILRILQEQKFERVGGAKTISVDVRIIAASNKDLQVEIERGTFRNDLYYRLNVVRLVVPPLRDRLEDIPGLSRLFLASYVEANRLEPKTLDPAFMDELRKRDWPGNIRELKNTIERLAITTPGAVISTYPEYSPGGAGRPASGSGNGGGGDGWMLLPYREAKAEFERRYFRLQLDAHDGNVTKTAEDINLDRSTIHKKLNELEIKTDVPRTDGPRTDGPKNGI
ncbi:MAG: sigma-54 dependent transcriptional regulator [Deltaproteobacteria bacterium]|jgi:two-component system nitrogen regulation response regulator NtrX|nr:sigma-54 dependent transcriptional regulator [Deltaproteobacteria bacterium]